MNENSRIDLIFKDAKTICFGRFLIDVPANSDIIYSPIELPWEIYRLPGMGAGMANKINNRLEEIKKEFVFAQGSTRLPGSLMGRLFDGVIPDQKIIFGVVVGGGEFYKIESYLKLENDLFIQEAEAFTSKDSYEKVVSDLNTIAPLMSTRKELEIPDEPGVCMDGGFVLSSKIFGVERIGIGIRLKEFPDVHMSISTVNKDVFVPSDALEPRLKSAAEDAKSMGQGAWYARIKNLRRGTRTIGHWKGFEMLARMPAQAEEGESHEFLFLSQGEPGNPYLPLLDLELHTGMAANKIGGGKPSISDAEAVALWDKLTSSIRVRPTKDKPQKAVPTTAELGTIVLSGTPCPQTGWWKCTDGDYSYHVEGGERQHFVRGTLMPKAVLVATQSLWQKITSGRTRFSTDSPSIWKLVEIDSSSH